MLEVQWSDTWADSNWNSYSDRDREKARGKSGQLEVCDGF